MPSAAQPIQPLDWSEITIRDNYMFATVFRDPELCRDLIQAVLGKPIEKVVLIDNEVERVPEIGAKGIRMDVYVADGLGTVYDVEMQNANEGNLAKRSRYYLSANDIDCIAPSMDYEDMRDSFVIFVCSFDPFERGLPRYYVTPHCQEDHVEMPDGSARVFINATAWEKCDDYRLSSFLHYLCGGTIGDDEFTKKVDHAVQLIKHKPEWRRNRMKLERYLEEQRIKAIKEGREEGRKEGRKEGLEEGREEGREEQQVLITELGRRLMDAGRYDEFLPALSDREAFRRLLVEFGLNGSGESA